MHGLTVQAHHLLMMRDDARLKDRFNALVGQNPFRADMPLREDFLEKLTFLVITHTADQGHFGTKAA